jgi:hypothetical protein
MDSGPPLHFYTVGTFHSKKQSLFYRIENILIYHFYQCILKYAIGVLHFEYIPT